jgi:hypothetical protein
MHQDKQEETYNRILYFQREAILLAVVCDLENVNSSKLFTLAFLPLK